MAMLRRRLTIPAQPTLVREHLKVRGPRFLPQGDRPPLLSFSGNGFVEEFLALASRGGVVPSQEFPPLFAWRDWSEPPEAMLTAQGRAVYVTSRIHREPPLGLKDATASGVGDRRDPDGIPTAVGPFAPPWLRKLYLPQHERFTVVCVDVVCERHGQPWLDRRRVKEAGMIVRRLRPDAGNSTEGWEDWFPGGEGEGSWQERFDADLRPLGLTTDSPHGLDPLEAGLASHPLRLIPADPDPRHLTPCRLYGYLPVFSGERQRSPDSSPSISAWQRKSQERLEALRPLLAALAPPREELSQLLQLTLLPNPASNPASLHRQRIRLGLAGVATGAGVEQLIDRAADHLLKKAIRRLGRTALDGSRFHEDVRQDCADGETLWTSPGGDAAAAVSVEGFDDLDGVSPGVLLALRTSGNAHRGDWDALVRRLLRQAVQTHLVSPSPSGLTDAEWSLLLAAALVRARGHLLALASAIQKRLLSSRPGAAFTPEQWNASLPAGDAAGSGPAPALHSMEGLLEWVSLFRGGDGVVRVEGQEPDIGPSSQSDRILAVLGRALSLRHRLDPLARELGEAGSIVRHALAAQARQEETALLQVAGIDGTTTSLASLGVPPGERLAEGVLLFPGSHPTDAVLDGLKQRSLAIDGPTARISAAEIRSLERSTQLRYDSRHLYAAWCWVRVRGRTACERDRVIWSRRSEPFRIADPQDLLGLRPVSISMPDLPRLVKDLGRLAQARAKPFASVQTPPQSGFSVGQDLSGISRRFGLGGSCSFGIPVFTICALVLFSIVFTILSLILQWLPLLQICTPSPEETNGP